MLNDFLTIRDGHLSLVTAAKHRIDLTARGKTPIYQSPVSPWLTTSQDRKERNRINTDRISERAGLHWMGIVHSVRAREGRFSSFCVNYRKPNAVGVRDSKLISRIEKLINSLAESNVFCTLDVNAGYWQKETDKDQKEKTAFLTHHVPFRFKRMPFGQKNAPMTTFLCELEIRSRGFLNDFVFSPTPSQHIAKSPLFYDWWRAPISPWNWRNVSSFMTLSTTLGIQNAPKHQKSWQKRRAHCEVSDRQNA